MSIKSWVFVAILTATGNVSAFAVTWSEQKDDIYGPPTKDPNPCKTYACPPGHQCLVGFTTTGQIHFRVYLMQRAVCRPDPRIDAKPKGASDQQQHAQQSEACSKPNICGKGKVCQSTQWACNVNAPQKLWCDLKYICIDENRWYGKKLRITNTKQKS